MRFLNGFLIILSCTAATVTVRAQKGKDRAGNDAAQRVPAQDPIPDKVQEERDYLQAVTERILGNKVTGLALTAGFVKKYPKNAAGFALLGDFYLENGNTSQAIAAYQDAIKLDETEKWFSFKLAEAYTSQLMFKEAIGVYEDVFRRMPEDPRPLFYVTNIYRELKQYGSAAQTLEKIKQSVGNSYELSNDLQNMYFLDKNYRASMNELENLRKQYPDDVTLYGKAAELYMLLGQKEKAMEQYQEVLKRNPNDGQIHLSLAGFYLEQKNWEKSIFHLSAAMSNAGIDIDKKVAILLSLIEINAALEQKYSKDIGPMLQSLLYTHPSEPKAYSIAGDYYMSVYRYAAADSMFLQVLDYDKNKLPVWSQALYIERLTENWKALDRLSEEALETFPNNPEPYLYKGVALSFLGRKEEARSMLESGKALVLNSAALRSAFSAALGDHYAREGNKSEALKMYNEALKEDGANADAMLRKAAFLLQENGEIQQAENLINTAEKQSADLFSFYAVKGLLFLRRNNLQGAKDMMASVSRFGGEGSALGLELSGDIAAREGKNEDAVKLWELARVKSGGSPWLLRKIAARKYVD